MEVRLYVPSNDIRASVYGRLTVYFESRMICFVSLEVI